MKTKEEMAAYLRAALDAAHATNDETEQVAIALPAVLAGFDYLDQMLKDMEEDEDERP